MTTIREAFDAMGYELKDSETVCIVTIDDDKVTEQSLHDVADLPVGENRYYSTGAFPKNQRFGKNGRNLDNVDRILEFPFDFDLKDFLGQDKATILELSQEEVDSYCGLLQKAVEDVFAKVGLPIHRLDYTGNGLSAHITIPSHDKEHVKQLKDWHAAIVTRINAIYGSNLADLQVKDAGPRIMRLVPSINRKVSKSGVIAMREPRTLYRKPGFIDQAMLESAADVIVWQGSKAEIPYEGDYLTSDEIQTVIDLYGPYHTDGQKHFLALAIAGQLAKMRVPEAQALQIIVAISNQDRKPWDRQKCVHDTYDRIRNGKNILGYQALKDMIPSGEIEAIDTILETAKRRNQPTITFKGKGGAAADSMADDWIKMFNPPPIPEAAFFGWHKDWRDLAYPTTAASPAFHLAASTTFQAAMMGRRISIKYAGSTLYPNQFTIAIGKTKSFKDTAYRRTMEMVQNAKDSALGDRVVQRDEFRVEQDFASREALIETLSVHPNVYLFSSEITTLLKNATREGTSTLLDTLIQAWDNPVELSTNSIRSRKNESGVAKYPYLSIYGGTQPKRIGDHMTETMISSGLGNRIAFFMGQPRAKLARTPEIDFEESVKMYHRLQQAIRWYPEGTAVQMSDSANRVWDDWFYAIPDLEDELAADISVRHPEMAQKWALMFAVSEQSEFVEARHLEAALAIIDWMWNCVQMMLPGWGVSNERKIEERILTVLRQRQPMKTSTLTTYVRGRWTYREIMGAINSMLSANVIKQSIDKKYLALSESAFAQQKKEA